MGPGDVGPLLACGRTIKFHFCRANVFELAIKQRFSPASQRTTRPRRGVGPFSFFVYSPANWFCGIHRPFSLPRLRRPPRRRVLSRRLSLSLSPLSLSLSFSPFRREPESYFGVRKYTRCVCEGCQREHPRRTRHVYCRRQKSLWRPKGSARARARLLGIEKPSRRICRITAFEPPRARSRGQRRGVCHREF